MEKEKSLKYNAIIYTILAVALVVSLIWGIYTRNKNKMLTTHLENNYNKAFHELTDYVEDIENQLHKGMLASSASQLATISSEIFRQSTAAKACLGELPTNEIQLDNTSKFLSQVGDYTYVLSQNVINQSNISDEDYKNLESLTDYAGKLKGSLSEIRNGIYDGTISFVDMKSNSNTVSAAGDILTDLENVEKSFDEYPSLIYDGPFSEHIENRQSVMINNADEITLERAKQVAAEFLNIDPSALTFESDTQNSSIDAYNFVCNLNDSITNISITKRGGYVLYFIKNRDVAAEQLNFTDAIILGENFLKERGILNMTDSYYDKNAGVATINYAYVQDNVTCYSDLVKVKVALDNGEILGMETNGYLMNHRVRQIGAAKITKDEAKSKINPHLAINSYNLALIPKDSLEEVLCYEFHGNFDDRNYIIYINVENMREERILMLIESDTGILTV